MEEILKKVDASVEAYLNKSQLFGFQKAYVVASAINELKKLLTDEYMKPIMALQGSRLGFRTDKDKAGGYPIDVVRNCLIEAVMLGLQPTGNEFNIIAGNMYVTREGMGSLLKKIPGLQYDIVLSLPRLNQEKTSAAAEATITWTLNSHSDSKIVPIPVKIDQYATVDSINGKATRKARAWLHARITGNEVPEGETVDGEATVVSSKPQSIELEELEFLFENKKLMLPQKQLEDIARIISNKETASYKKAYTVLSELK